MRFFAYSIISLLVLFPVAALAEPITVPANKTSVITGFWVYGENNCHHAGRLKHRVGRQPEHGKIVVKFETRPIPEKVSKRCAGKPGGVMIVFYTPDRGYRGKDNASVSFQFSQYQNGMGPARGRTFKYALTVK